MIHPLIGLIGILFIYIAVLRSKVDKLGHTVAELEAMNHNMSNDIYYSYLKSCTAKRDINAGEAVTDKDVKLEQ